MTVSDFVDLTILTPEGARTTIRALPRILTIDDLRREVRDDWPKEFWLEHPPPPDFRQLQLCVDWAPRAHSISIYLGQVLSERTKLELLALPRDGPAFMHLIVKDEPSNRARRMYCTV